MLWYGERDRESEIKLREKGGERLHWERKITLRGKEREKIKIYGIARDTREMNNGFKEGR